MIAIPFSMEQVRQIIKVLLANWRSQINQRTFMHSKDLYWVDRAFLPRQHFHGGCRHDWLRSKHLLPCCHQASDVWANPSWPPNSLHWVHLSFRHFNHLSIQTGAPMGHLPRLWSNSVNFPSGHLFWECGAQPSVRCQNAVTHMPPLHIRCVNCLFYSEASIPSLVPDKEDCRQVLSSGQNG